MRETAIRIFAAELNSSSMDYREDEEKGSVYIITPLGAKVNRVLICGVLSDLQESGSEEGSMLKGTLSDPTGDIRISAGQYQEEARRALASIPVPSLVAIVGKARTYRPEEGAFYPYIRLEAVATVNQDKRNFWMYETCRETEKRIGVMKAAMQLNPPTVEALQRLGIPYRHAHGAVLAYQHYGQVELQRYREAIIDGLRSIGGVEEMSVEAVESGPDEELTSEERTLLEIIGQADRMRRGIEFSELMSAAAALKLTEEQAREAINGLLEKGMIYEPSLGKVKRI